MKQVIFTASCISLLAACSVKNNFTKNNYTVSPNPLELKGDSVEITINANVPAKSINPKTIVTFSPYLKCEDGTVINLKEITIKGTKAKGNADETVDTKMGGKVSYSTKIAYTPNMKRAQLMPKFTALGKEVPITVGALAEGTIVTPLLLNNSDHTIFTSDDYKVELVNKSINIYFPLDNDKFNPNFKAGKNLSNKDQIKALGILLKADTNFVARGIAINAYASPDGELDRNTNLSKGREESTFKFFKKQLSKLGFTEVNDENFTRGYSSAEDWLGFEKAIISSEYKEKDAILEVLRNKGISDEEREGLIRRNFPKVWEKAKTSVLPSLRRSELIIKGASPMKTDAELLTFYGMYDKLTPKELFHLAVISTDLTKKQEVLNAYNAINSEDWRSFNNLAVSNIQQNDFTAAKSNLDKALALSPENPTLLANYGVVYKLTGNYSEAIKYYNMAGTKGADVSYNLGLLAIKNGNYAEAISSFNNSKTNDFNTALALLLNGNAAACKEVIDGLNPDELKWNHYYLRAVAAARANNADDVAANLIKAIGANSEVRNMAKSDMEFSKMFSNPLFQGAIR
jgi:tetratricopeptide (TPR) repeat protein